MRLSTPTKEKKTTTTEKKKKTTTMTKMAMMQMTTTRKMTKMAFFWLLLWPYLFLSMVQSPQRMMRSTTSAEPTDIFLWESAVWLKKRVFQKGQRL
jgi:hypothetical protein